MQRGFGFAALLLGSIGLMACLAGLIFIWVVRPTVLRSSAEILDAADGGLTFVEEKSQRAAELVKRVRDSVDPIAGKILKLADKTDRTPEEEKDLNRIEVDLAERLRQVDAIAEAVETAVAFLRQTSRLARSLRAPASHIGAGETAEEDSRNTSDALARLATKLKELRDILAKFRADRDIRKEITENVVLVTRNLNDDLKSVDSKLHEVCEKAVKWRAQIAELRFTVPAWTNRAAIIGSALLVWLGLGQFALARWGWRRACAKQTA